jgi:hypothetical protein
MGRDAHCIVARANGPAPARLICGDARKDIDLLAPYMATKMPTEELSSNAAYFELRAEPIRARFGKKAHMLKVGVPIFLREVSLGNPRFDGAVAEAAHATVAEALALIQDLDRVVLQAKLEAQPERMKIETAIVMRSKTAWTSQTLAASVADNAPAPEMFWRLPTDAAVATYSSRKSDPKRFAPIVTSLVEMAGGAMEHYDLASAKLERLLEEIIKLSEVQGPSVYAQSTTVEKKDGGKQNGDVDSANDELLALTRWPGYTISGVVDPDKRYSEFVERLVDAYNDPSWRKGVPKDAPASPLRTAPKISSRAVPKSWGLPTDSKLHELTLSSKWLSQFEDGTEVSKGKIEQPPTLRFALLVTRQGDQTWLGYGNDGERLAKTLAQVLSAKPAAPRPELMVFKTESALSGAYWSILTFVEGAAEYALAEGQSSITRDQVVRGMPNQAKSPIVMQVKSAAEGPSLTSSITVDRAAAEDLAAAFVMLAAESNANFD